jgi:hypothetical protein
MKLIIVIALIAIAFGAAAKATAGGTVLSTDSTKCTLAVATTLGTDATAA